MTGSHSRDNLWKYYLVRYFPLSHYGPLLLFGALFFAGIVFTSAARGAAATPRLAFVVNNDAGIYHEIRTKILQAVRTEFGASVEANVINIASGGPPAAIDDRESLIVTVGTNAARYAYKNFKKHSILSTLITYDGFQHNVEEVYGSEKAALSAGVSAVLLEQPVKRYFELGATLVPEAKKVGVLLGPSSLRYSTEIEAIADAFGVTVELVKLKRSDNPIRGIKPVLKQVDYFIVLPDQQAFNRSVAKWVLQLSYRHRVPVIGYSKRYAEAGAIASVFSSADDIASEASRLLLSKISDPAVPNAAHVAEEFSVQLNPSVAKAIGITLPVAAKKTTGNGPQRYEAAVQ